MNPDALPATVALAIALTIGVKDTWFLRREYKAIAPVLVPRYRGIGRAFVVASYLIILAIGWFGLLTVRRLLGFEPFTGEVGWLIGIVGLVVSVPVLLLPRYFRRVWQSIGDNLAPGTKAKK